MIYLYGLLDGDIPALTSAIQGMPGLEAPVECSQIGDWALVHSNCGPEEIIPRRRLMLAHARVQEAMMPFGTVLPTRFGLVAEGLEEVRVLITGRAPIIRAEFERVRGCVELGLRIQFDRAAALAATLAEHADLARERDRLARLGREAGFAMAEFGGKLADRLDQRRGRAQSTLLKALVPLLRDHVLRRPDEDVEVLRCEILLPAAEQTSFMQRVEDISRSLEFAPGAEPMISVIGPVPPYNFVRLSLASAPEEKVA